AARLHGERALRRRPASPGPDRVPAPGARAGRRRRAGGGLPRRDGHRHPLRPAHRRASGAPVRAFPRRHLGTRRSLRRTRFDSSGARGRGRHRGVLVSEPSVSYVIPVHNQIAELRRTVRLLVERLAHLPGSEIILVENGSTDGSGPPCLSLATALGSGDVVVRVPRSAKGVGFAWRGGMAMARGDKFVLTAADLPFGFTDLDG